jgi:hypothetical protein
MPQPQDASDLARVLDLDLEAASEFGREDAHDEGERSAEHRRIYDQRAANFRPVLEAFIEHLEAIRSLDDQWRRDVFAGRTTPEVQVEKAVWTLYANWSGLAKRFRVRANYLSRQGVDFSREVGRIKECEQQADRILEEWHPPALSRSPSFRTPPLSPDSTARLRELFPGKV